MLFLGLFLEDSANRWRDFFVGAVNAPHPAAGTAFAFGEFGLRAGNASRTSFIELGIFYPAEPFVAGKLRKTLPRFEQHVVCLQDFCEIRGDFVVNCASRKVCHVAILLQKRFELNLPVKYSMFN